MIKIDLITGFLGSGKTTFIKKYAAWLLSRGERICILENDFGAVNVDRLLLQELAGDNCELEMLTGGCCKDTHGRRFRTKLISMAMTGYDRVLVEPSGVYDVDEFFDTLREEPLDRWYEVGSVIAVVDAGLEQTLAPEAEYLLASETARAGCVVLSRSQEATCEKMQGVIAHLNRAMADIGCKRVLSDSEVLQKAWDALTEQDFERISGCGAVQADYRKQHFDEDDTFQSLYFMNLQMPQDALRTAVREILADPACGRVCRVKGYMRDGAGGWLALNATAHETMIEPVETGQEILIVIGEELVKSEVEKYFSDKQ